MGHYNQAHNSSSKRVTQCHLRVARMVVLQVKRNRSKYVLGFPPYPFAPGPLGR